MQSRRPRTVRVLRGIHQFGLWLEHTDDRQLAGLPSGGPIYPLDAPSVRLEFAPFDRTPISTGSYSADPAGRCDGDPKVCNQHGLDFHLEGPQLLFAEIEQRYALATHLPGMFKVGRWRSV